MPIHLAASSSRVDGLTRVPRQFEIQTSQDAAYLHYTSNETIGGVQFDYIPQSDAPLVCDMSSDILSAPLDVSKFGVIYAGAQKNIGPAGITLVIIREDLLELAQPNLPPMFSYKTFAENGSMYNTPPTFAWYLSGLVFKWLQEEVGGLEKMAEIAFQVNRDTENIGARRLHTILEKLLEDLLFESPDMPGQQITITAEYVDEKISHIIQDDDLRRYIL